jgi:hypothetical protein
MLKQLVDMDPLGFAQVLNVILINNKLFHKLVLSSKLQHRN